MKTTLRTLISALVVIHGSGFGAQSGEGTTPRATQEKGDGAAEFDKRVRPLLTTHCLGCHSTRKKKGGLDLERFATLKQVRADIEPWQAMLEMLENDEMPPEGKRRPQPEERRFVIRWIRSFLGREAERRAGDPGPVPVRRLNNAEYTYTIRDLTGVDLRPARQFPADGAAGEGFLNATDALAISPDLLAKYLDAAKEVAAHAVLLPDGVRFSTSTFREDWVNEVLGEIRALHARYATDMGEIPVDRYLRAGLAQRDAIRSGRTSLAQVAKRENLSPQYLKIFWQAMTDDRPSVLLEGIRAKWKEASTEDVPGLVGDISALQGLLWHKQQAKGEHALEDRYVPAPVSVADTHTFKLVMPDAKSGKEAVFYLVAKRVNGEGDQARIVLKNPRFESRREPPLSLRDALRKIPESAVGSAPAPPKGVSRLDVSRFGSPPREKPLDETSMVMQGSEVLEVRLPGTLVSKRTFVVEAGLDPGDALETVVQLDVRRTPTLAQVERGVDWQHREGSSKPPLLVVRADEEIRGRIAESADEFRRVFPARLCYPGVIVRDTTVTLERFHRGDGHLSRLMLDRKEHERLDRLWGELHYISRDALQVRNSLATLVQGEMKGFEKVFPVIRRRAKETEKTLQASEPKHLESVLGFASRAYRRPLTEKERRSLRELYQSLRQQELPHEEALRSVLARVLMSVSFLYRLEQAVPGAEPGRVSDWELATRLSYFLWSSIPDEELRRAAAAGRLHDPQVLARQTRRMLKDPRSRALAIEFGTQWVEVRGFDRFQGKNPELFPTFDAKLRRAMYEESVLFFQDMFRADRPIRRLIDADHTFVNETLAKHYGISDIRGEDFRRVEGVKQKGRGGMLVHASVLSKHSGASRTSPVLRGIWVAEILLGEKLPRPPDDVPELPEDEAGGPLTVRQMVEKHAEVKQCAICHQRIDPLGFALEQYDTIGRWRERDLGGRPVDANARLRNGTRIEGIDGLRRYLLTQRKADFVRQFCRKLLGYALGRRVLLSDRKLLGEMAVALEKNDGRLSAAVLTVVRSRQFQFVRGSEPAK